MSKTLYEIRTEFWCNAYACSLGKRHTTNKDARDMANSAMTDFDAKFNYKEDE